MKTHRELLDEIHVDMAWIKRRTRQVLLREIPALLIYGRGGTSKSYSVIETAREMGIRLIEHKGTLTGPGVYSLLAAHPDGMHLFEDIEPAFRVPAIVTHLRSATWGQPGPDGRLQRIITRDIHQTQSGIPVTGGLIFTLNTKPNAKNPAHAALFTRMAKVPWQPSDAHLAALMRQIATRPFRYGEELLTAEQCLETTNYLIGMSAEMKVELDLRLQWFAFRDRLSVENDTIDCSWQDCVLQILSEAQQKLPPRTDGVSRKREQIKEECDFVRSIRHLDQEGRRGERIMLWNDWNVERGRTGCERRYYRRLKQVEVEDD